MNVLFDIDGAYIAQTARARVSDGAWDSGLRILQSAFPMLSLDIAVDLLKGEKTLAGSASEGISVEDVAENDVDLAHYRRFVFGQLDGIFRWSNTYWKPYAQVQGLNKIDHDFSKGRRVRADGVSSADCHFQCAGKVPWTNAGVGRAAYYAENPKEDLYFFEEYRLILCRKVNPPAFWLPVVMSDLENYVADYIARNNLPVVGAFGDTDSWAHSGKLRYATIGGEDALGISNETVIADAQPNRPFDSPAEKVQSFPTDAVVSTGDRAAQAQASLELEIGAKVRKQAEAMGGFFNLTVYRDADNSQILRVLKVPRAPFERWALSRVPTETLGIFVPEWTPVSESGMKLFNDNSDHTDWMLGAGLNLDEDYDTDSPVSLAASDTRFKIVQDKARLDCVVLTGKGRVSGKVVHPGPNEAVAPGSIAIVPNAGPAYQLAMESACSGNGGAVICESGGRLAHLVIVGREMSARLVMLPGALTRYPEGMYLSVDCDDHHIGFEGLA